MARVKGEAVGTIEITAGDILLGPSAALKRRVGEEIQIVDLTDSTVVWRMVEIADDSQVAVNNGTANIDDEALGEVSFDWTSTSQVVAGTYAAWWIRTKNGKTETFPSGDRYIKVVIAADH